MAQPAEYVRQQDYSDYQENNPGSFVAGADLDADFAALKTTTDQIRVNLALLQRDDGAVKNGVVGPGSFSTAALALIAADWTPRGLWVTATAYEAGDLVESDDVAYVCAEDHTSGTLSTDHTAGKWIVLSTTAANTAFTAAGNLEATNVQDAIEELDAEKQPLDAELTAIAGLTSAADRLAYFTGLGTASLATFTAFARTLLDDATAAAARTTLGLDTVSQAEAEAGTETTARAWTAARVAQAITALQTVNGEFRNLRTYSSDDTWTKPAGLKRVRVTVIGAGGGGVGRDTASDPGSGGGGGGTSIKVIEAASLGATETVTVGEGGAGGVSGGNTDGTAGETSSFGSHCSATGGAAATAGADINAGASGLGGLGADGDLNFRGSPGVTARFNTPVAYITGGNGGASYLGGGGKGGVTGAGGAGGPYGGGGGGAHGNAAGGAGADGVVIVEEFF